MLNRNIDLDMARARVDELTRDMDAIHMAAPGRRLNAQQQADWTALDEERTQLLQDIEAEELNRERAARVAESRKKWGSLSVGGPTPDPYAGLDFRAESPAGLAARAHDVLERSEHLDGKAREAIAETIDARGGSDAAAMVLARSSEDYRSAFTKVLQNPERAFLTMTPGELAAFSDVESVRAAMSTNVASAGYLLPLSLDPNVLLANAGTANPIRQLATLKVAASSPHRAVTSAGVTGEWLAEAATFADASPTFTNVDVPLFKMGAYVFGSYEVLQDSAADVAALLPDLLADARDRLESAAFATGNGTTAPKGVVTALAAANAFVTATTRGSFTSASAGDVLSLLNAQSPRTRQSGKAAWIAHNDTITTVRQQTVGTAGALLMDIAASGNLLGHPIHEASSMTNSTTSGSYLAVLADFSRYAVVDHIQGPSLEFVQNVLDPTTNRPTGQRGWIFWHRVGADMLDTSAGKILKT